MELHKCPNCKKVQDLPNVYRDYWTCMHCGLEVLEKGQTIVVDKDRLDWLIEQIAAHEGGVPVILCFDECTRDYIVMQHNKMIGYEKSLRKAIDKAMEK